MNDNLSSRTWVGALALVGLVWIAFGAAASYGFTNWDDDRNYVNNAHLNLWGWQQIRWAFTTAHMGVYQPLAWLLLTIEWYVSAGDPAFIHKVSLLLAAANAVVLWRVLCALLPKNEKAAWLAAALFALHPLRAEVVAWASCQPYLGAALFFMLSVLAYVRGQKVAAFVCYIAAVLFKAPALTLPLVLVILDIYPLRRAPARRLLHLVWEKLPYLAVMITAAIFAVRAKDLAGSVVKLSEDGWQWRVALPAYSYWFYLAKTVLPWPLSADYFFRVGQLAVPWKFWAALLAALAAADVVFRSRHRWPWLAAAASAYMVILAPNIGFVRIGDAFAADRYTYLATLPWVVCAAAGLGRMRQAGWKTWWPACAALAAFLPLSARQTSTWHNSISLWSHALAHGSQDSATAHNNMGIALFEAGRADEAIAHYREACRLSPKAPSPAWNLGHALAERGSNEEGLIFLNRAITLDPADAFHQFYIGVALVRTGHRVAARAAFEAALKLQPDYPDALVNLATLELDQGNKDKARALLSRALELEPRHAFAHFNLGLLLFEAGDREAAIEHYRQALLAQPNLEVARRRLDEALTRQREK